MTSEPVSRKLTKPERVRGAYLTEKLFSKQASSLLVNSFRFSWVILEKADVRCSVLFVGSKKKLKTATSRNRRKRLLKELYRQNKHHLLSVLENRNMYLAISLNYVGSRPLDFHHHTSDFIKALIQLGNTLQKNNPVPVHPAD